MLHLDAIRVKEKRQLPKRICGQPTFSGTNVRKLFRILASF